MTKANDRFRQFALAVASDTGDAQDLALPKGQRNIAQSFQPLIAESTEAIDLQNHLARFAFLFVEAEQDLTTNHHLSQSSPVCATGMHSIHHPSSPKDGDAIGDGHHLPQFMADEDNGLSFLGHATQGVE